MDSAGPSNPRAGAAICSSDRATDLRARGAPAGLDPGGVHFDVRLDAPELLFFERGEGAWLWMSMVATRRLPDRAGPRGVPRPRAGRGPRRGRSTTPPAGDGLRRPACARGRGRGTVPGGDPLAGARTLRPHRHGDGPGSPARCPRRHRTSAVHQVRGPLPRLAGLRPRRICRRPADRRQRGPARRRPWTCPSSSSPGIIDCGCPWLGRWRPTTTSPRCSDHGTGHVTAPDSWVVPRDGYLEQAQLFGGA